MESQTGTYTIDVVAKHRRDSSRWEIGGHRVSDRQPGGWYTRNNFIASLCNEAQKSQRPVSVTWQSCWWGEELKAVELVK